jgi:hypothetical protein
MNVSEKQNKNILPVSPFVLRAEEINQLVAELQYIITLAELVPDSEDTTQVWEALQILFATFSSTQIIDDNGENEKTQAERNREYEAALAGGVTGAYPAGYLHGGLLTYNTDVIVDIAASKSRSSDNTKNIEVAGASLDITTNANWASGTAPSLVSTTIYVWATYHATTPKYLFDNVTGSNITVKKRLVAKLKTNASSEVIKQTLVDFSDDPNSINNRARPDFFAGVAMAPTGFTASENGYIYAEASSNPGYFRIYINDIPFMIIASGGGQTFASNLVEISKDDVCRFEPGAGGTIILFIFYPCKGNI